MQRTLRPRQTGRRARPERPASSPLDGLLEYVVTRPVLADLRALVDGPAGTDVGSPLLWLATLSWLGQTTTTPPSPDTLNPSSTSYLGPHAALSPGMPPKGAISVSHFAQQRPRTDWSYFSSTLPSARLCPPSLLPSLRLLRLLSLATVQKQNAPKGSKVAVDKVRSSGSIVLRKLVQ